jgi:hypothetical protein
LNRIRAAAQIQVNDAQSLRDQSYSVKMSAYNTKNSAYSAWQNTPRRQVALRAQRHAAYVGKVAIYNAKAAAHAARQATFLAKRAVLNAIPSPDTDPILIALINQSDQLWAELERRQQKYRALSLTPIWPILSMETESC